jgi:hypothetical protein
VSFDEDFEDVNSEPLVFTVDSKAIMNLEVNWWKVDKWITAHPGVCVIMEYERFHSTIEFPSRELMLEFFMTFPGVLKGE